MDFNHTADRTMLKDMVSRFIADNYALEDRHKAAESSEGFSREMWSQFSELGLIGALFAEDDGGFGGAGFDINVLFEELGRGLVVEPFLASALLGGSVVAQLGDDGQKALIAEVVAGTTLLALAHGEPDSYYDLAHVETTVVPDGDGFVLNGRKAVVLNGDSADHLVVTARANGGTWDEDGLSAFLVPANVRWY